MSGDAVATARWQDVAADDARLAVQALGVQVAGCPVVVVRTAAGLHALSGVCPHDHASLDGGEVEGGVLVCPRHRARFDAGDGRCTGGFDLPALKRYPVRAQRGRVEVDAAAVAADPPLIRVRERWDLTGR